VHIPDGFISPRLYLPLYAVSAALWAYGLRRVRSRLDEETIPLLAVVTAFTFVLMTVAIPIPGGTTTHATGIALLAVLFGVWTAFIAITLVLLMQALLFAEGGITALPVNALAMGLAGSAAACLAFQSLRRWRPGVALFLAGWLSVNVAALLTALALGIQPLIASDADGQPLFFPFDLPITLPAVMIPHLLLGLGEGALTVAVYGLVRRVQGRGRR